MPLEGRGLGQQFESDCVLSFSGAALILGPRGHLSKQGLPGVDGPSVFGHFVFLLVFGALRCFGIGDWVAAPTRVVEFFVSVR